MATKAIPITKEQLVIFLTSYLTKNNQMSTSYAAAVDATTGLIEKIAYTFRLPQEYTDNTYEPFWGDDLPVGANLEEYFIDPVMPADFNPEGDTLLKRVDPSFRKAYYSVVNEIKDIVLSISRIGYKKSFGRPEELARYIADLTKAFQDSRTLFRNGVAKTGFDNAVSLVKDSQAISVAVFAANTAYTKGTYLKDKATATAYGVVFKDIPNSGGPTTWANAVTGGYIVPLNLVTPIADITDEKSASDFILAVKKLAEKLRHPRQGYSLSGNLLGTSANLVCFVKEGVIPTTEVTTLVGAFNKEYLAMPMTLKSVVDFGTGNDDVIAAVMDERMVRAHLQVNDAESFPNAENGTTKFYYHMNSLIRTSPNVFCHVFTKKEGA